MDHKRELTDYVWGNLDRSEVTMTAHPFAKASSTLKFTVLSVLTTYWLDGGLLVTGVLVNLDISAS